MKPWWLAVLGITLASVPAMSAGITVVYPRSAQVQVPGATAAYSLDPINADASAAEGVVTIIAKNPGEAKIVIVTLVGVQTLSVTILQPPPSYPPGFVPPTQVSYFGENGTYEFRYSSDPAQWQNNLSFVRRQGSRRVEFRLSNANLLGQTSDSHISFPLLSYSVSTRRREFTILDETVDNSSLTVNGAIVRGFHYRQGGWSFHGGVASLTSFQGLLLSTDREGVAGLSRSFRLGHKSELVANLYGFQMQRKTTAAGRSGAVGSVLFRQRLSSALDYSVELGFSRGIAGAGQIQYSDGPNHLHAQFRVLPQKFAGLGINDLRGRTVTADGSRVFNDRLTTSFSLNAAGYNLANLQQSTMNLQGLVRYRLWRHWSVNSGVGQSSFTSKRPVTSQVETMSVPIGTDFATAHFGVGLEYQYQHNTHAAKPGRDIRVNARTGFKSVQVTGFAERQTQAPTLVTALPPNSPLTDTLANQNVLATTPQGLAAAERDNALLAGLGYVASQDLAVALRRTQLGGSLNWMSHGDGHDQLAYNFLHSKDEYSDRSLVFASHTLSYSRRITSSNDVGLSLTAFSAWAQGREATIVCATRSVFAIASPRFLLSWRLAAMAPSVVTCSAMTMPAGSTCRPLPQWPTWKSSWTVLATCTPMTKASTTSTMFRQERIAWRLYPGRTRTTTSPPHRAWKQRSIPLSILESRLPARKSSVSFAAMPANPSVASLSTSSERASNWCCKAVTTASLNVGRCLGAPIRFLWTRTAFQPATGSRD